MYFTSPDLYNPLNHNPIRNVLEEIVDFDRLRQQAVIKLFLCATNVRTGKVKVFKSDEIGADQVGALDLGEQLPQRRVGTLLVDQPGQQRHLLGAVGRALARHVGALVPAE